jgi:hypothetical protein
MQARGTANALAKASPTRTDFSWMWLFIMVACKLITTCSFEVGIDKQIIINHE